MNRLALPLAPLSRGAILLRIHYMCLLLFLTHLDEVEDKRLALRPRVPHRQVAALHKQVAEEKVQIISALISGNLNLDIGSHNCS
jgi:hypothetical protein